MKCCFKKKLHSHTISILLNCLVEEGRGIFEKKSTNLQFLRMATYLHSLKFCVRTSSSIHFISNIQYIPSTLTVSLTGSLLMWAEYKHSQTRAFEDHSVKHTGKGRYVSPINAKFPSVKCGFVTNRYKSLSMLPIILLLCEFIP